MGEWISGFDLNANANQSINQFKRLKQSPLLWSRCCYWTIRFWINLCLLRILLLWFIRKETLKLLLCRHDWVRLLANFACCCIRCCRNRVSREYLLPFTGSSLPLFLALSKGNTPRRYVHTHNRACWCSMSDIRILSALQGDLRYLIITRNIFVQIRIAVAVAAHSTVNTFIRNRCLIRCCFGYTRWVILWSLLLLCSWSFRLRCLREVVPR